MRSLNNQSVKVVVNGRQDRKYVAGTVELREGIFLSGTRLLGTALESSTPNTGVTKNEGAPIARMPLAAIPRGISRAAMRHWHRGHRYSVTCFACSS